MYYRNHNTKELLSGYVVSGYQHSKMVKVIMDSGETSIGVN